MEKYTLIIVAALLGAMAAIIKAIHEHSPWGRAILDGCMAFVLCGFACTAMMQYTDFTPELIGGSCGVLGMFSQLVSLQLEKLIDAGAQYIKKQIDSSSNKK